MTAPAARRGVALVAVGVGLLWAGCAPSPDELYSRGMAAFKAGKTEAGTEDLETFVGKKCGGGEQPRCRHAYVTLGHTYEKRGALARAWAAYDQALTFPPHKTDETLTADRDRVRGGLTGKQGDEAGRSPVIVRYRDEVTEEFTPRSVAVALDFEPILTKDKEAGELHTPEFHRHLQRFDHGGRSRPGRRHRARLRPECAQMRPLAPPPFVALHERSAEPRRRWNCGRTQSRKMERLRRTRRSR